jgi:hypothetical protein
MKKEQMTEWIMDYLSGDLDPQQEARFFRMLKEEGYDPEDLKKLEQLDRHLEMVTPPEVPEEMHAKFYAMLEEQKAIRESSCHPLQTFLAGIRQAFTPVYFYRLAYTLLLLLAGWTAGHWVLPNRQVEMRTGTIMDEIQELRKAMALTLLEQPGATMRLKAVHYTAGARDPDDTIILALLNTLNKDENINVRLASLDALAGYADDPLVREGLVQSIASQDSPLVQLALAELMIALQEKKSAPELRKLLEKEDLNNTVRETIEENIQVLI